MPGTRVGITQVDHVVDLVRGAIIARTDRLLEANGTAILTVFDVSRPPPAKGTAYIDWALINEIPRDQPPMRVTTGEPALQVITGSQTLLAGVGEQALRVSSEHQQLRIATGTG